MPTHVSSDALAPLPVLAEEEGDGDSIMSVPSATVKSTPLFATDLFLSMDVYMEVPEDSVESLRFFGKRTCTCFCFVFWAVCDVV